MDAIPLETRGSIFDARRENGILVGYIRVDDGPEPVLDIIRRDPEGRVTRTRHTMQEVFSALSTHGK